MYYFGLTALMTSVIAWLYLLFRYQRQTAKNLTTLLWSLAFLAAAISIWCAIALSFKESFPYVLREYYYQNGQYIFAGLSLTLFCISVARAMTRKFVYRYLAPLLLYLGASTLIVWQTLQIQTISDINLIHAIFGIGVWLPASLVLSMMFCVFWRHLVKTHQPAKSRAGAFTISCAWALSALSALSLFFVTTPATIEIWFGFFTVVELVLLWGIFLLEQGGQEALQQHLKIHGLEERKS